MAEELSPLDPDVQEALSRKHAPEVVRLLRLTSGRFAVYNHAGELCGIATGFVANWPPPCWHPAKPPPQPAPAPPIDLKDLGLA